MGRGGGGARRPSNSTISGPSSSNSEAEGMLDDASRRLDTYSDGIARLSCAAEKIGSSADGPALRTKLAEERKACEQLRSGLGVLLRDPSMKTAAAGDDSIRHEWREASKSYNKNNTALQRAVRRVAEMEKKHAQPTTPEMASTVDGHDPEAPYGVNGHDAAGVGNVQQQQFDRRHLAVVDVANMEHDAAIQAEKSAEIHAIEADVDEIAGCYEQLHDLVGTQQEGIDGAAKAVSAARENMTKGTTHVHTATDRQRSVRKWFACAIILTIVIAVIGAVAGSAASK